MLSLNVSCPNCGKQFKNIKPELAGKKAKCACGQIVRLGEAKNKASDSDSSPFPDDLMQVDLLGDELLGDDLLGDALLGQSSGPPGATADFGRSKALEKRKNRPSKDRPQSQSETAKSRPNSAQSPKPQPRPAAVEELNLGQSYSDLESILDGVGDAAPIVVRPPEEARDADAETPSGEAVPKTRKGSPVGLVSALLSGTFAFWFGVFALISKFKVIDQLLTSGFSQALHRMYLGDFGSLELNEVNERFEAFFMVYGWTFWMVALCLMILGATQFLNSLYRLFTKRHFFRSIDGLTATCGVVALFLLVGWIFAQASIERAQHKFLNEYEKPATVYGEELEVVTLLREEIDAQHTLARNWLLVGALIPMSVFVLSMTRLLTLKPDRRLPFSRSRSI